ncbi:LON peptidase substrate-binding domain-containing protein, partial [Litorivivens sp.]
MADRSDNDNVLDGEMVNHGDTGLVIPDSVLPSVLYLLPVPKRPFFPAQVQPILLEMKLWEDTLKRVGEKQNHVMGLLYCGEDNAQEIDPDSAPSIGCAVRVHHAHQEKDTAQIVVQGLKRFR